MGSLFSFEEIAGGSLPWWIGNKYIERYKFMHASLDFISDVIFVGVYFGTEPAGCVAYIIFMLIHGWFYSAEKKVAMQFNREPCNIVFTLSEWFGSEPILLYSEIRKISVLLCLNKDGKTPVVPVVKAGAKGFPLLSGTDISPVTSEEANLYQSIYSEEKVLHTVYYQDGNEHIACPELDCLDRNLFECIVPEEIRGQIDCCNINQFGVCAIESFSLSELKKKSDRYREWQRREFMATVLFGRIERVRAEIHESSGELSEDTKSSFVDTREKAREKIYLMYSNKYGGLGLATAWFVLVPKMIIQL